MNNSYPKTQDIILIIYDHQDNKTYKDNPPSKKIFKDYFIFTVKEELEKYLEETLLPTDKICFFIHAMMDKNYNWVDGDFANQVSKKEKFVKPSVYFKNKFPELFINYVTKGDPWDAIIKYGQRKVFNYGELRKHFEQNEIIQQTVSDFYIHNGKNIISTSKESENLTAKISKVDVAIIAALYNDEFQSLKEFLEDEKPVEGFETMKIANLKNSNKKILVDFQTNMGMVEATYLSTQILARFSPKYLIMVGVCGGRATKGINLLDILIPNKVFDYQSGNYENGKFKPYLRVCNINNKKAIDAADDILKKMEKYFATPLKKKCKRVTIRSKTLACGNVVVKTDGYLEKIIAGFDEETEGVEMESFGVVRATELLEDKKVNPIIIKSVMDFTEKSKDDKDKANAAYFSACFTYFLVKDHL